MNRLNKKVIKLSNLTLIVIIMFTTQLKVGAEEDGQNSSVLTEKKDKNKINKKSYKRIKFEMTLKEVEAIYQGNGLREEKEEFGNVHYKWQDQGGDSCITFKRGRVVSKFHSLPESLIQNSDISRSVFRKIKCGMDQQEAIDLLGVKYQEKAQIKINGDVHIFYQWNSIVGGKTCFCLSFLKNKVDSIEMTW